MMALSVVRFALNGWIEKLYLEPAFFFSYRGFAWVRPLGDWTYALFALVFLSAVGVMLGWRYRLSALLFFLSFAYVELMDKTTYLNHYYFISLVAFALIWLPAGDYFSLDARRRGERPTVPAWTITALKVLVGVVYFYAGLAKLNSDWLLHAQPLSIWLPAKYDVPLLGEFLSQRWVHFAFAWAGAAYDLLIPFLLLWRPTRPFAFVAVVIFHVLTRVLFPIGMFPYIMIVSALVFFEPAVHHRVIGGLRRLIGARAWLLSAAEVQVRGKEEAAVVSPPTFRSGTAKYVVYALLLFHLLFPWRYLAYPGELFWTESGYRFSWRVMLMEKAGYASFTVVDPDTGKRRTIDNRDYLTTFQEKQMATQPDFILEFAHFLARKHRREGRPLPAVYVESYAALNGRRSRPYADPKIDLTSITHATPRTEWLLAFEDDIYGL